MTIDPETRYDHGLEWFEVWSKLPEGGPEFDWDGRFFKLKRLQTDPVSVQRPRRPVMSAGFSPRGRDFAARAADVLFLNVTELDQVPALLADVAEHMARYQRTISVFTMGHVACRPTRQQAEDYFHYFAEDMAGCTIAFVDYLKEIPFFVQEVLPRLERLGLRGTA